MRTAHDPWALQQMQSLPLEAKILMSQRRIEAWFNHWDGQVYISFSGGKDSTVLKHLVENTPGVYDVPSVFVDTGLEYPEVRKFATERADVVIRPEMRFDEVVKTYGYPVISKEVALKVQETRSKPDGYASQSFDPNSPKIQKYGSRYDLSRWKYLLDAPFKISNKCCDVMKKRPVKKYEKETGRTPFIGSMVTESSARKTEWLKHGCNAFTKKRPTSQPLSFWTEQDVLQYIVENNLEYASVYGEIKQDEKGKWYTTGCDRTGCMFCMFGCHLDKSPNRFQRMKETHPKQYDYCMRPVEEKGLGLAKVLDYIGVDYK